MAQLTAAHPVLPCSHLPDSPHSQAAPWLGGRPAATKVWQHQAHRGCVRVCLCVCNGSVLTSTKLVNRWFCNARPASVLPVFCAINSQQLWAVSVWLFTHILFQQEASSPTCLLDSPGQGEVIILQPCCLCDARVLLEWVASLPQRPLVSAWSL